MTAPTPEAAPHAAPSTHAPRAASRYLRAARGEPVDTTPVWFMRQAGRALPEYRAVREQASLREITRDAALCAEVTLQPVRRLGVDAAILFADITTPFEGMGVDCEIREGVGPVIERPVRSAADLARFRPFDAEASVAPLLEAIALIGRESPVPLIGFAGAPFTLACYLVEGGPSRDFVHTKRLMHEQPTTWAGLMDRLVEATTRYLRAQVAAGADALQVFDSWVGGLSPLDYERRVRPWMRRLFDGLRDLDVPVTHFGVGTAGLLPLMASAGGDVVGLDWRISLSDGRALVAGRPVQGNLDPALLLAGWGGVEETARWILAQNEGRPGHVFNLGHGVLPGTDPDLLARLVDLVHEAGATR